MSYQTHHLKEKALMQPTKCKFIYIISHQY